MMPQHTIKSAEWLVDMMECAVTNHASGYWQEQSADEEARTANEVIRARKALLDFIRALVGSGPLQGDPQEARTASE